MKKIERKPEILKDGMNNNMSKPPRVRASKRDTEDLTCSEGQVEGLLSEGESTEADGVEDGRSEKRTQRNPSSR